MNKEALIQAQWYALGQDQYEIGQIRLDGKMWNDKRRWSNMREKIARYTLANDDGKENIYIRAVPSSEHEIVFLDDVSTEAIAFLKQQGIAPACVVETSKDNFQAWFRLASRHPREIRKAVERNLIGFLADNGYHADSGSADGMHYGRLVGFTNQKPGRDGFRVALIESTGTALSVETSNMLVQQSQETATRNLAVAGDCYPSLDEILTHEYTDTSIVEFFQKMLPSVQAGRDPSAVDYMLAARCAKAGYSEKDIQRVLVELGPNDPARKSKPSYYIVRTVGVALARESQQSPATATGMRP